MLSKNSYLKMIAGVVPEHGKGKMFDSIAMLAQESLGEDGVHIILSPVSDNGRIAYFAIPSSALASEISPKTPIAAALPGHPDHKGEGAYVLDVDGYKVAAVYRGNDLTLVCNEPVLVNDYISDLGLPEYSVNENSPWQLESAYTVTRRQSAIATRYINKYSFIATIFAAISYVGASFASGYLSDAEKKNAAEFEQSIQSVLKSIKTTSPLSETLAKFQAKTATTIRAGGWVDFYEVKEGRESFRVYLPQWATRDYVLSMGQNASADKTAVSETLIQVVSGTPPAEDIKRVVPEAPAGAPLPADAPPTENQAEAKKGAAR